MMSPLRALETIKAVYCTVLALFGVGWIFLLFVSVVQGGGFSFDNNAFWLLFMVTFKSAVPFVVLQLVVVACYASLHETLVQKEDDKNNHVV